MNIDLFMACIDDPQKLKKVSYQELKTLAYDFPYATHFKQLLWEKSHLENLPEKEKNLNIASLYSIDRKHLSNKYKQLNPSFEQNDLLTLEDPLPKINLPPEVSAIRIEPKSKDFFSSWNESVGTPFTKNAPLKKENSKPRYQPVPVSYFKKTLHEELSSQEPYFQEQNIPTSENYAKILVKQNQIEKAIEVYKRLILIFPEKSTLFAGEIENLKKN